MAPSEAGRIGLGMTLSVDEFNRRALIALKVVEFGMQNRADSIVDSCAHRLDTHQPLSEKQQQALYNIVHRYRKQITDQAVKDFAVTRAKGAD